MAKLVVIQLEGDFHRQGFHVTLEIGTEGDRPSIELQGKLPPAPDLPMSLQQWEAKYRNIDTLRGQKAKQIIYNGSMVQRVQECRDAAKILGDCFQDWMTSPEFLPMDKTLREELTRTEIVRVLIRSNQSFVQKLPWHLWDFFEHYPKTELALSSPSAKRVDCLKLAQDSVKILAILGHQEGIDIELDRLVLENLPDAAVTFLVEPTPQELSDRLWEESWDILFFAGHSETQGDRGRIYINPRDSLTLEALKYGLTKAVARGLQIAIFNSCDGLGLARELAELNIPQTVVMREPVPDSVAQRFLQYFLAAFSRGESFYLAMREARERLEGLEGEFPCASWLPVICQNPTMMPPSWADLRGKSREPSRVSQLSPPLQIPEKRGHFRASYSVKLVTGIILASLGTISWQQIAPNLATRLNNSGIDSYGIGDLSNYWKKLDLAWVLDPYNPKVYYNKAWSCEDVLDYDCARSQYQKAARLGSPAAYNQLGSISIKVDEDDHTALHFFTRGLQLATQDRDKFALYKNLGWSQLKLGREVEALESLEMALNLHQNYASPYCLLAQVRENLGQFPEAVALWEQFQILANPHKPEEHLWLGMAKHRLSEIQLPQN
ncbi:CHAT domain-containing protein [Phormidium pseudopriestleyi FRX01]|uniref:CHAT domain-containing protein n=1 Tax=Phormidium pseudopriestleyi FRX01 TaxID=1759528 RepID=A0ABS3FM63_9CYAN|nr:CHAT domain-containing protein [Phormidium pseudopriestleyi]MBO0348069.1 CHAT domain-containing protein [Phormidium pseudopriestleyi FRX01]